MLIVYVSGATHVVRLSVVKAVAVGVRVLCRRLKLTMLSKRDLSWGLVLIHCEVVSEGLTSCLTISCIIIISITILVEHCQVCAVFKGVWGFLFVLDVL